MRNEAMTRARLVSGTYILVFTLAEGVHVRVGRLGTFEFPRGWYAYVGSALGPGGLRARLSRHARPGKRLHWHIDYMLQQANLREIWLAESPHRWECTWAHCWLDWPGAQVPVPGFGASDCGCLAHLFATPERPLVEEFLRRVAPVCGESIQRIVL